MEIERLDETAAFDSNLALLPSIETLAPPPASTADDRRFSVLGVEITDLSRPRALVLLSSMLTEGTGQTRTVYFVNAHTLNLAARSEEFRRVLGAADYVFGDGTGVRWAARLQKIRVRDNLCGTDLVPQLMRANSRRQLRYYLLGGDSELIGKAAAGAQRTFNGWTLAGCHHGYLHDDVLSRQVIEEINRSGTDLLLVGMGNPRQEQWVDAHRDQLRVPLCIAVGGLFHYWADDLRRAPRWVRRLGIEWLAILLQQPHKAARYLVGNPRFLYRICRERLAG